MNRTRRKNNVHENVKPLKLAESILMTVLLYALRKLVKRVNDDGTNIYIYIYKGETNET